MQDGQKEKGSSPAQTSIQLLQACCSFFLVICVQDGQGEGQQPGSNEHTAAAGATPTHQQQQQQQKKADEQAVAMNSKAGKAAQQQQVG